MTNINTPFWNGHLSSNRWKLPTYCTVRAHQKTRQSHRTISEQQTMSDEILDRVRDALEGQIDFEGQRLAELLSTVLLSLAGIVAFIVGFITHDIAKTLWIGLGGAGLALLVVVPPWPFFNKHPVTWLPSQNAISAINIEVDGKKVG